MASKLYTKLWATTKFLNRSKRIMFDPSFANRLLLKENNEEHVAEKYGQLFLSYRMRDVKTIFVPVLIVPRESPYDAHWFCIALDLKARKLWMIDLLYPDPFQKHAQILRIVLKGIDVLFTMSDQSWKDGEIHGWEKCIVEPKGPSDALYCGVFMLAAIKFCARRFTTKFGVGKIHMARPNLFLDDARCDINDLKDKLEEIVPAGRKTRQHQ